MDGLSDAGTSSLLTAVLQGAFAKFPKASVTTLTMLVGSDSEDKETQPKNDRCPMDNMFVVRSTRVREEQSKKVWLPTALMLVGSEIESNPEPQNV